MAGQTIASKVIKNELKEQMHPVRTEDVIFWALEYYMEHKAGQTIGKAVAFDIVHKILDAEAKGEEAERVTDIKTY